MSILLIKTSSRAISGTFSSDFLFPSLGGMSCQNQETQDSIFFFLRCMSQDNLFDKSARGVRIQSWHLSPTNTHPISLHPRFSARPAAPSPSPPFYTLLFP
ncbi:hypothetical protein NPIL_434511, partial [Nephila pilipes]